MIYCLVKYFMMALSLSIYIGISPSLIWHAQAKKENFIFIIILTRLPNNWFIGGACVKERTFFSKY